jgi:hypothetical protein
LGITLNRNFGKKSKGFIKANGLLHMLFASNGVEVKFNGFLFLAG